MTGNLTFALTFLAAIGSGVMAGLFFVFSNFAMTALGRLPAEQGIAAMQSINVAILNPYFFVAFFGTAILSLVLAAVYFLQGGTGGLWLLAGAAFYLIGIVIVTMVFNVPLNNELAAAAPGSAEGAAVWSRYLDEWVLWNHVRTLTGIAALVCFVMALR